MTQPSSPLSPDIQSGPGHNHPSPTGHLVQPHSVMLLMQGEEFSVVRVSQNVASLLDFQPDEILGLSLQKILAEEALTHFSSTQTSLSRGGPANLPQYIPLSLKSGQRLEGWLHQSGDYWILELEAAPQSPLQPPAASHSLPQFRSQVAQLQRATTAAELLEGAAIAIQQLTHLDRVLIYRFAPDGSGTVAAEVISPALESSQTTAIPQTTATAQTTEVSYLGLRFPNTDIPEDSRQQYAQGKLRYVPDVLAKPVELVPALPPPADSPETGALLHKALFQAVDPCCITYHSNISVRAFLVVPLLQQGQLWGLMVGHHGHPLTLPTAVRLDCAWLGQILSAELAQKESQQALMERERLKAHQSEFLAAIAQSDDFVQGLINPELRLLGLANAEGAAVFFEDQVTTVGKVPPTEFLNELYDWANTQISDSDSLYYSHSLPQAYPAAEAHKDTASGMLFLQISSARRYAIAWFRPEVLQTISWAGNPADSYEPDEEGELRLCPRDSFSRWQETVRLTALPWQPWEVEIALDLRNAIIGVVLRKADEITRINHELERSNQELAAFAYAASHDLKEPLRGINNYTRLIIKENRDRLDEKGIERLNTLTKLSRRMGRLIDALLRFSRIGQTELHLQTIDLNLLIARVVEMQELSPSERRLDIWTPRPLPSVQADPVLLSEVYNNLLSNALKYNTSDTPWVELGYYSLEEIHDEPRLPPSLVAPVLYVRDNGIGIPEQHWTKVFELFKRLHSQKKYGGGTGAGLTITQKIIERHGGQIGLFSDEEGTTFYWTLG